MMRFKLLCLFSISVIILSCGNNSTSVTYQNHPKTPKVAVKDYYFGKLVIDNFRHLENLQDSATIKWFKAQDDYTENYLQKLSYQKRIMTDMKAYFSHDNPAISMVKYADNGYAFFLQKEPNENVKKLFFKKTSNSKPIELFDPKTFQGDLSREYTINYIQPSWDGRYILVAISYDGIKGSNLIIIEVDNQKPLPEIISNAEPASYLGISWLPDSSGFLYLYLPILDSENKDYMLNTSTVLYKLGENPEKRHVIFSSSLVSNLTDEDLPIAKIQSKNDKYIIGYKATVDNYWSAYYAEISDLKKDNINWKPFYSSDDKIYADYGFFLNDEFVYISGKNADNRNISSFNINQPIKSKILIQEKKNEVLTALTVSGNNLYYTSSKFGVEAFLYEYKNQTETKIELPSPSGDITLYSASNENPQLYVGIDGWTTDYTRYIYENNQFFLDTVSSNKSYTEFENLEVKEVLVKSYDGVEVPLSIIYNKNLKFDSESPTFIYTYGAYGESISPYFSPIFLNWVIQGGVFAVPHIRGGGEKGDSWHEDGMKSKKYNSWKDIIACTEYLIKNKFTSKDKTVLYSSSAGGIAIGMAMVERPDLFKVFVADVPMLNPLRSEERKNNASNYLEYGTVKDSTECMGLIAMDPYVNLKPNINYPASLVISGFNDARIDPWIPGKFVAKLQEYSTSNNPVFLDVVYNAGHEGGDTIDEYIDLYSRIFAFAFWQTEHKLNP
ncbi:prolyl oligopeptidase family serine peptidase [Mariniflexile sp.]|uniref:prolyl oligopeptidase family serine peptidase n=2 Tax=Mariniflexile sp. TaxID=1979402 RepID=UPI0040485D22